jgi:hypothetical protein
MNTMDVARKVLVCALTAFALTGMMSWALLQSSATVPAYALPAAAITIAHTAPARCSARVVC